MAKTESSSDVALGERAPAARLHRWLYDELRRAILDGRLRPGARMPSSRSLAQQHGVARGTAVEAFDQLVAEGYLETRIGSGTFVRSALPERFLQSGVRRPVARAEPSRATLSARGRQLTAFPFPSVAVTGATPAFRANQPALDLFPADLWSRLAARCLRGATEARLAGGDALGHRPLREALAAYLGPARGVHCGADEIVITSGTQQSLDLAARLLLDPGDQVWMEDPGYLGATQILRANGAEIVPVPVDAHGLDADTARQRCPAAKLAYVTPAHQFPLTVAMSLPRRLALLRWAQAAGAWIFEDDYDSEFRFSGRPLAALRSLDASGCVLFAGSFNKMLFPALRLGYLVVPPRLAPALAAMRAIVDRHPPMLEQAIVTEFLAEGHFGRHLRRMREIYAERLDALTTVAQTELAGLLDLEPARAGLQTIGWLAPGPRDADVVRAAAARGIEVGAVSRFALQRRTKPALILGFGAVNVRAIRRGTVELARVLRDLSQHR